MAQEKNTNLSQEARERIFGNPVRNLIICAIVCILLGAAYALQPGIVYSYCSYAIGGLIGLIGFFYIIIYFARPVVSGEYRSEFGLGLVLLAAGIYIALGGVIGGRGMINIGFETLIHVIGVLIILDGVMKLQYTLDVARMHFHGWWLMLLLSLIGIALGVVTYLDFTYDVGSTLALGEIQSLTVPQNAFISGMMSLGAVFVINGILDLVTMIVIAVRNRKAARAAAEARREAILAAGTAPTVTVSAPGASYDSGETQSY